mmetsp:Transcript_153/g.196  ORF Transcript_153/g.196 Transcript_153/m.196 type:complete len:289 (-) Transcript_153:753-1619(-)
MYHFQRLLSCRLRAASRQFHTSAPRCSQGAWVGHRVLPSDLTQVGKEPRLPWGFIAQDVVESEIIPEVRNSQFARNCNMVGIGNLDLLKYFDLDEDEVKEGIRQAYFVVADIYSNGNPLFESNYTDMVEPALGRCFDAHIKQFESDNAANSTVDIARVVDVDIFHCFPIIRADFANEPILENDQLLASIFGVNEFTARLLWLKTIFNTMRNELSEEEAGKLTLVLNACVTVEEKSFNADGEMSDSITNRHVLSFSCTPDFKYFFTKVPTFRLANFNEALALIQSDEDL